MSCERENICGTKPTNAETGWKPSLLHTQMSSEVKPVVTPPDIQTAQMRGASSFRLSVAQRATQQTVRTCLSWKPCASGTRPRLAPTERISRRHWGFSSQSRSQIPRSCSTSAPCIFSAKTSMLLRRYGIWEAFSFLFFFYFEGKVKILKIKGTIKGWNNFGWM